MTTLPSEVVAITRIVGPVHGVPSVALAQQQHVGSTSLQ